MAREKETFRDNLERLKERFPDQETITINDAVAYLGAGMTRDRLLRDETFPRRLCGGRYIVVLVNFARWLAA